MNANVTIMKKYIDQEINRNRLGYYTKHKMYVRYIYNKIKI